MKTSILPLSLMVVCWSLNGAEKPESIELMELVDFTTSVKRQLEKEGVLEAYEVSPKVSVQLVWSDEDAAPWGQIAEEKIKPRSPVVELNPAQRLLLLKMLREDSDYEESMASCLCTFQPQLRVVFHSRSPEATYDILVSGISHGEVQAFRNGTLKAYARTSLFVPDLINFLAAVFPDHDFTQMLREFQKTRNEANKPVQTTPGLRPSVSDQ